MEHLHVNNRDGWRGGIVLSQPIIAAFGCDDDGQMLLTLFTFICQLCVKVTDKNCVGVHSYARARKPAMQFIHYVYDEPSPFILPRE